MEFPVARWILAKYSHGFCQICSQPIRLKHWGPHFCSGFCLVCFISTAWSLGLSILKNQQHPSKFRHVWWGLLYLLHRVSTSQILKIGNIPCALLQVRNDGQPLTMSPHFEIDSGFFWVDCFVRRPAPPEGILSSSLASSMNISVPFSHLLLLHGIELNINLFTSGCKHGAISKRSKLKVSRLLLSGIECLETNPVELREKLFAIVN